jgi:uncharacterized protein (TIGR02996 family)
MNAEEALFREFLATLDEGTRRRVVEEPWWLDSWGTFISAAGAFSRHYQELGYIEWLGRRGDCRGEFLRLLATLSARPERAAGTTPFDAIEDEFVKDVVSRPADVTPRRVYADWLEEKGDGRADLIRHLARLEELSEGINPEWVEVLELAPPRWPPKLSYARWTAPGQWVMHLANQEAQRFNHRYVGSQHILLAFLREEHRERFGPPSTLLARWGLDLAQARRQVERRAPIGPDMVLTGKLPQSARAKSVVCFAWEEAEDRGLRPGPDHLLLGVCRANPCVATRVLRDLGISPAVVAAELIAGMGGDARGWVREHPEVW